MAENLKNESSLSKIAETEARVQDVRKKIFRSLFACLFTMGIVSFLLTCEYATRAFELAYFLGALVGIINGVIGFLTIEKFIDKSNLVFMKGVFVGMGIRLLVLLGVFVLLVKVFDIHIIGLVTGLLIFYFSMTIFEVILLNNRIVRRSAPHAEGIHSEGEIERKAKP